MPNYYVFRINYGDKFEDIRKELLQGRLRQGWGVKGMSLNSSFEEYSSSWKKTWGENDTDDATMLRRFNNLKIMNEISIGDVIVIPKVDINKDASFPCQCFTVAKVTQPYTFSVLEKYNDFGHIIGIEPLFSCKYHWNTLEPLTISAKFKAYQKPLNHVYNGDFISAVDMLIKKNETTPIFTDGEERDFSFIMAQKISEEYSHMVDENLQNLQKMDPKSFEYLIKELFEKNGFICNRMNDYDGNGGDIDIQMMLDDKTLLGALFKQAKNIDNLYINIQAKKKEGTDWESKKAVEQLVKKRNPQSSSHNIDIVIDLTDEYDEDTENFALKNHVILINGRQFSYLLLHYGFTGEIVL